MHLGLQNQMRFLWHVVRSRGEVGAILPSSQRLGEELSHCARVAEVDRIIELGAGAGAITREILRRKKPCAKVLAIEREAPLATSLRSRFPNVRVVNSCASRLDDIVEREDFGNAGAIISTLPWTILDAEKRCRIIQGVRRHLKPDGFFVTAVCFGLHWLPQGEWLRICLGRVARRSLVLRNIPPVLVYQCSGEGFRQGTF